MPKLLRGKQLGRSARAIVLVLLCVVLSLALPAQLARADAGDNYPWKTAPFPNSPSDTWGYAERWCTSWVAWALHDRNGFEMPHAIGNASAWAGVLGSSPYNYPVNGTPAVGAIAQWNGHPWNGNAGHVAWVSAVNSSSSIVVEEYNVQLDGTYAPSPSTLTTGGSNPVPWPDNFIHVKDINKVAGDWDGDGKTNLTIFRPSDGTWHWRTTAGGDNSQQFGQSGDIPVPAWYSSDGKLDYAVFRPSNSTWLYRTQGGSVASQAFGLSGDIPVPGDYDGVGHTEYAVFRPSNASWHWYCGGDCSTSFGQTGDIPVPAIWDGGAKTEPGVFRPSNGTWYYLTPTGQVSQQFGVSGDDPFPGYYSGAAKPDYGQFRPSNSTWYWYPQGTSGNSLGFGSSGDIPMPGYYTGSTTENFGIYRPSNGTWHWYCGGDCSQAYGQSSDIPAVSVLPYPILHSLGLL